MADNLSPAARHFGEAMCPPGDTTCVNTVGSAWERDVEARFGALQSQPPQVEQDVLYGGNGQRLGTLRMIDRTVTLCFEKPGQQVCGIVGVGREALDTAKAMLGLQGISARPG